VELLRNMKLYAPDKPMRPTKGEDGEYNKLETDDYWAAMNIHRKAAARSLQPRKDRSPCGRSYGDKPQRKCS
jgi:hypothetical protein